MRCGERRCECKPFGCLAAAVEWGWTATKLQSLSLALVGGGVVSEGLLSPCALVRGMLSWSRIGVSGGGEAGGGQLWLRFLGSIKSSLGCR